MTAPPGIFLVDDDPFQLHLLGGILRAAGHRVEAFERPESLLARLSAGDRGCVVLDLRMPGLDGLSLYRALVDSGRPLPVVFVSGRADLPDAVAAMKQGAVDFLEKPVDPAALLDAVAAALRRDAEAAAQRAERDAARAAWAALSDREREVCRLCARGLLLKQIAAALAVAESTAHTHRSRVLQKLSAAGIVDLIRLVEQVGDES